MNYRNFIAGAMVFALAAASTGCSDKKSSDDKADTTEKTATESSAESASSAEAGSADTTRTTEEEKTPPVPTEASDPNAVTFDDNHLFFTEIIADDEKAATGTLSVAEVMGNKMLKFTDDNKVPLEGKVQKISVNAAKLIGTENLPKVRRIEFDLYAQATSDKFVNEDGENAAVPGWIGGGGGTVTAQDEKWYEFGEFSGGEYDFDMSGAVHCEFKFLLADSGQCWSEDMTDANFLIMRWGLGNESNMFIDNIVFYDENDKSIPVSTEWEGEADLGDVPEIPSEVPEETATGYDDFGNELL